MDTLTVIANSVRASSPVSALSVAHPKGAVSSVVGLQTERHSILQTYAIQGNKNDLNN